MKRRTRSPASDLALRALRRIAIAAIGAALVAAPAVTLWAVEATARWLHGQP